ncbi:MAG: multicopper oxidase domain-containing protein, partial [Bacillota bacterium]|nr:multicopper oxidase domain-containing protein [Bacillota bacterium]
TDSGFLERPIAINSLTLAPAERAEVVLDFTHLAGKVLKLRNNAPTPFPNGEPVEPDTTGSIMQFRISKKLSSFDDPPLPAALVGINWLSEKAANVSRFLELNEDKDSFGRPFMLLDKKMWDSPISENPVINSLEIWNFINLTNDDHPIHLHLVQFQVLNRQNFDLVHYKNTGSIRYTGHPIPSERQEMGWKDTVRTPPEQITRIIVPFTHFTGQYVWHCHILEHEDYEMMRPYRVLPGPKYT